MGLLVFSNFLLPIKINERGNGRDGNQGVLWGKSRRAMGVSGVIRLSQRGIGDYGLESIKDQLCPPFFLLNFFNNLF